MELPSEPVPSEKVRVRCLKEVSHDGKLVKVTGPVQFELDGKVQDWKPGEERSVPVWAWELLQRRGYLCFELVQEKAPEKTPPPAS